MPEFVDIVLVMLYAVIAVSVGVVVWSKMRSWGKTLLVCMLIAAVVAVGVWMLPGFLDSDDKTGVWTSVADVFLALIVIALSAAAGSVVWSMMRGK